MIEAVACLTGTDGTRIALQDVRMNALLRDLLAEVTMTQIYRNEEQCAIEAVYTFPLPPAAVLLGLEVTLGERRLQATIVEKKAAERRYEEAVADGDSAVMLEQSEPGLYTLNLGNLLPGEDACVTLHYALLQRWDRNRLRLLIPTTIAPRYGRSPLSPAQQSEVALTVENRFTLQVEIAGTLAQARVTCPTHAVATESVPTGLALRLHDERAVMDRDFVLEFLRDTQGRGCAWTDRDGDGAAAIACFQPSLPAGTASPPLSLVVIVDCSGSMAGDAIAQARKALATILTRLTPADRLEIIAFGSRTCAGFGSLQGCSRDALARAEAIAAALQADLGGTEIGGALRAAFDTFGADLRGDVFLITDGEVADWQPHMAAAAARGHRIFTVGVGNAVSEAFVRGLADATGGACELVTPREGMAGRVVRHFERLRTPRTRSLEIHWPEGAIGQARSEPAAAFDGDTLQFSAHFAHSEVTGSVRLDVAFEDGTQISEEVALVPLARDDTPCSTSARLAAAQRLARLPADQARATALDYGLVSDWTNLLLVVARDDASRPTDLPALRKVPQTLAAGWGGTGVMRDVLPPTRHVAVPDLDMACYEKALDCIPFTAKPLPRVAGIAELTQSAATAPRDSRAPAWYVLDPYLNRYPVLAEHAEPAADALLLAFEHLPAARKSEAYECLRVLSQGMPVSWADILRWDLQPSALAALMLHAILAVAAERGVLTRPQLRRYARQRRGIAGSAAACKRMRDPQATCAAVLAEPGLPDLLGAAGVAALSRSDTRLSELRGMLNILIEESRSSAAIRLFATAPGAPQATSA